jgi:hypothetical protein
MANQPTARAKFGITSIILNLWTCHLSSVAVLSNLQAFLYFPPECNYYNLPCIIIYYSILSSVGAWWNTYNSTRSIILNPRQGQQHIASVSIPFSSRMLITVRSKLKKFKPLRAVFPSHGKVTVVSDCKHQTPPLNRCRQERA